MLLIERDSFTDSNTKPRSRSVNARKSPSWPGTRGASSRQTFFEVRQRHDFPSIESARSFGFRVLLPKCQHYHEELAAMPALEQMAFNLRSRGIAQRIAGVSRELLPKAWLSA